VDKAHLREILSRAWSYNWNLSLLKDLKFRESMSLEFRAEFFNYSTTRSSTVSELWTVT